MSKNKEIGRKGESQAVDYLINKGYTILETNYRYRRYEIDIIAKKKDTVIFIEVKTRRSKYFGYPEEAVNDSKIKHILACADHFIHQHQWDGDIRFDIISILHGMDPGIRHIEDAFY